MTNEMKLLIIAILILVVAYQTWNLHLAKKTITKGWSMWNGEWHQTIVQKRDNTIEIYVDGRLVDTRQGYPITRWGTTTTR